MSDNNEKISNDKQVSPNNDQLSDDLSNNRAIDNKGAVDNKVANNKTVNSEAEASNKVNTTQTIIIKPQGRMDVDKVDSTDAMADDIINDDVNDDVNAKESRVTSNKSTSINASPSIQPPKQEDVPPTDVSLICENKPVKEVVPAKKTSSKWGYQLLLVLFLMGAFAAVMAYQTFFGELNRPEGEMTVEEGQSYYGLLPPFQRDVPMFSAMLAKIYIKYGVDTPLNAGVYDMPENPNIQEFLHALQQEQEIDVVAIQVIEGKTAQDLYTAIANTPEITLEVLDTSGKPKAGLKQALGIDAITPEGKYADNLEGWFTPDTYHYAKGATDKQILTDLYNSQRQALDKAWENRSENLPYETPYEALIMASIIEKETSVPSERERVSAVFVNRLKQGMRLQTDPTIIYGMGERYDGDIRRKDIDEKTDYNTYQIDGLPPTPIALPSHASIEAAMHPADDDALYFVATGTGGHKFSKTLAEHNKAVQDYLQVMREKQ